MVGMKSKQLIFYNLSGEKWRLAGYNPVIWDYNAYKEFFLRQYGELWYGRQQIFYTMM